MRIYVQFLGMTPCTLERAIKIGKLTENIDVQVDIESPKLKSSCCISTFVVKVNHSKMSSSTLIEVFGHIVFSFTQGVTEHYNPEEPEFTAESFGYDPLESTGREWYYRPVDEFIFQEYSDRRDTAFSYLPSSSLNVRCMDACTPEENEETLSGQQDEDRAMAWKRLRPSTLSTVWKALCTSALISLLTAAIIGVLYIMITYVCYQTIYNCQFHDTETIPEKVQWIRTMSDITGCVFLYLWFFGGVLLLFRPYQIMGLKGKLFLVAFFLFSLDALYRVALQLLGISHSKLSVLKKIPLNVLFLSSVCWQIYLLTNAFRSLSKRLNLFFKMLMPSCFPFAIGIFVASYIYPMYSKQDGKGKLLIAIFSPLIGVVLKVISRICVQRLWRITHPGRSFVLLAPLYFGTAVMFRVLQAELDSLKSIAILGIVHGAAEVIERSTMVIIDHVCHVILKRKSAAWGSFRTPRRERLMADVAILSMLYESTAIISVNSVLYLYQFIYIQNTPLLKLLQKFAIHTSVALVIEWFFTSASLAIVTRYQNIAVMAVWRKRWKRHILVAIANLVPLAIWTTPHLLEIVHGRFYEFQSHPCKMPFA